MTINIPAEKIARFIRNTCDANLPALRVLQAAIEVKRGQALSSNQALGNFNIDVPSIILACGGALAALEMIADLSDGLTEVEEAKLPNQPTQ